MTNSNEINAESADPRVFLENLGYTITEDSDQPGLWVWYAVTDGCDSSYDSKEDAFQGAFVDAASQAMGILDMTDAEWISLGFEQQKAKIIAALSESVGFDDLDPDTQMEWVAKVRVNYPDIGPKEAFRLAENLYEKEG